MNEGNTWHPESEKNEETITIPDWTISKILKYSADELLKIHKTALAVLPQCEAAAVAILSKVKQNGRIITIGAGGSGVAGMSVMRELPQNHSMISPGVFTYLIAGGDEFLKPLGCEEIEDSWEDGKKDAERLELTTHDVVILISASGRTPYTRAAAAVASIRGAYTIGLICQKSELLNEVQLPIYIDVGPEIFIGATCEMSATAQKHVLDMIMNAVVAKLGITKGNICQARLVHEKARIRKSFFDSEATTFNT